MNTCLACPVPRPFATHQGALWRCCLVVATLCFGLAVQPASAADANTGIITGRVLNATNDNYLPNAQVTVEGTNLTTLTNDFGEYRLTRVPAGTVKLVVTYSGQLPQTATVAVQSGASVSQDIQLGVTAGTPPSGVVQLDAFKVEAERFKNATDIAINEERHSVNFKNVVAADAFGDIPSGNVGEFIKYLPGVELDYGGTYIAPTDAFGISVRGFGAEDTAIYVDGVPVASASQASLTTQVGLDMMSINNASRIELVKVPTPDMPMNSVGGQINLISKSAFEYGRPSLSWRAYVTINSEEPNPLKKVAGPKAEKVYAGQPGFELTYVRPVNKQFGISLTASSFSQFSENRRYRPEWGTSSITNVDLRPFGGTTGTTLTNANGVASLANPYMTRISITDAPRTSRSSTGSIKADWRPFNGLSVSGSYQYSQYVSADAARRLQIRIQRPMSWDANSTISYPYLQPAQSANGVAFNPSSSLDMNVDSRDKEGHTHTGSIRATYQRGPWDVYALASFSTSRASFKDLENGHFSTVDVSSSIGQIKFENIVDGVPGKLTVYDRNGNVFDYSKFSNWSAPTIQARSGKAESLDDAFAYQLDIKRELDFIRSESFRTAVKVGGRINDTLKKKWGLGTGYRQTYAGPTLAASDYLDNTYVGYSPGFGFPAQEWISTYRLYDIYAAGPTNFNANSDSDRVSNYNSMNGQNKRVKERKTAWYAMLEGSVFNNNRLNFVAGLRAENDRLNGAGPQIDSKWNYLKNADGTLYRNVAVVGGTGSVRFDQSTSPLFAQTATGTALRADLTAKAISFPATYTPISTSTPAGIMLQRKTLQPIHGESKGKPSYSLNLAYNVTPNVVGRVAWSRTFGRIPIENGTVGLLTGGTSFNINENDNPTAIPPGTIAVANPNVLPEVSDNWDFGLSYYSPRGGKIDASFYTKKVKNFLESVSISSGTPEFNTVLESLGLDPADYPDWQLNTSENGSGGSGSVQGYEISVSQDLRFLPFLGDWGRRINTFGTYSHTHRSENNTTRISARPAASQLATAGINLTVKRLTFNIKGTWRDTTFRSGNGNFTVNGTTVQLGTYDPSGTKVDASLNWQFSKKYAFYASGRNIFANGLREDRMDLAGIYPAYAQWDDLREFGVQVTFGIKGTF